MLFLLSYKLEKTLVRVRTCSKIEAILCLKNERKINKVCDTAIMGPLIKIMDL